MTKRPDPADVQACEATIFDWAEAADTKNFAQFQKVFAPRLDYDYTSLGATAAKDTPKTELIDWATGILKNPKMKTQHLIGVSKWELISDTEIVGHHQISAAHYLYHDEACKDLHMVGVGRATNDYTYKKIDGEWLIAGLTVNVRFSDPDLGKILGH